MRSSRIFLKTRQCAPDGGVKRRIRVKAVTAALFCVLLLRHTLFPYGVENKRAALAYIEVDGKGKFYSLGQKVCEKTISNIIPGRVMFRDGSFIKEGELQ